MRFRLRFPRRQRKERRVRYVAILPTLITLGNGVCGLIAIYKAFEGQLEIAGWLILLAMVFDGLDGKVARATRSTSAFGTQLDSLCDLISFGVAPSVIVFNIARSHPVPPMVERLLIVVCLIYACGAIIRLARFNVETEEDLKSHMNFDGLPSPGAGGLIASTVITYYWLSRNSEFSMLAGWAANALPVTAFFLGLLMVSRIRYPHVMNRLLQGFRPFTTLIEIALAIVLFVVLHEVAIFVAFFGYAVAGPLFALKSFVVRPALRPGRADERVDEAHDQGVH